MYGMNLLFGNNFGFGGFGGGCGCCHPNPFMLGAMRGYTSAMMGYALMGGGYATPSIFGGFNPVQTQQQSYSYSPQTQNYSGNNYGSSYQMPSYSTFVPNPELNSRYAEASSKWSNALSKLTSTKDSTESVAQSSTSTAATVRDEKTSATTATKVKSDKDFKTRVEEVAKAIVCKPEDLLALMNSESGLKADAQNKSGQGAVGLIQFTTPAIKELNRHGIKVTKEELLAMSPVEQLDYVEKYLKIAKSYKFAADYPLSAGDLYAINYLPGRASSENLASRGDKYYEANKGLDIDGDGIISKSDLAERLNKFSVSLVA